MLIGGVSSWGKVGDVTTNVDIDFSNPIVTSGSSPKNSIAGEVGSMKWDNQWTVTPSIVDGILRFGNFTGSVELQNNNIRNKDVVTISFDLAFGKLSNKNVGFTFKDKSGTVILSQEFNAYNSNFNDKNPLNLSWEGMYNGSNTPIQERCVSFTIELDYANATINTHTKCFMSGTGRAVTEKDFEATLPSSNPLGFFELYGNINNGDRYSTFDNLLIKTTEGDYTAATADYTIKYMSGEVELKEAVVRNGDVGSSISLTESDKIVIWKDNVKYIYDSDDASSKTIAEDNSTIVTVNFREAYTYNYTVKSSLNTTITTGSAIEGETVRYPYARYLNVDGTLYDAVRQGSNPWWGKSFVLTEDNHVETVNYNATSIKNVVYFTETEDIPGATKVTGSNADIRCSMQAGGNYQGVLTTLQPGKYKLMTSVWGNAGQTFVFKAGESTILSQETKGYIQDATSDAFIVTEPTEVTIEGGDNNKVTDFICIYKVGNVSYNAGDDATMEITNPTIDGSTGWTCEKRNGGNGPLLNNNSFEYWAGNATDRDAAGFDYYQTIMNLPNGYYTVSAEMKNSLNDEAGAVFNESCGVYGNDVMAYVTVEGNTLTRYTTDPILVTDGTLRIGVKSDKRMGARWFVADNFTLSYHAPLATCTRNSATGRYGTLCLPYDFDAVGAQLFTVTGVAEGVVGLTEVGIEGVAGQPYIFSTTADTQTFTQKSVTIAEPIADGYLVGTFEPAPVAAGNYVLQTQAGRQGFFKVSEETPITCGAFKCYLKGETVDNSRSAFFFDGDETAINALNALTNGKAEIYDLNGRKLNSLQKGINIVNGVKVLVK